MRDVFDRRRPAPRSRSAASRTTGVDVRLADWRWPKPSLTTPIRRPLTPRPERARYRLRSWPPYWRGSSPSGPASTSSSSALSATVAVIGPVWSIVELDRHDAGVGHEARGSASCRRCRRTTAGMRIEPPWSPPIAMSTSPAATSAAAAGGRAAGRVAVLVRVVHRADARWCGCRRRSRNTRTCALPTIVAPASSMRVHDGGVDIRDIAFERRGAVHHRHAGEADIVLHRDRLALQLAARRALDRRSSRTRRCSGFPRPSDDIPACADSHRRHFVRHPVDDVVGGEAPAMQARRCAARSASLMVHAERRRRWREADRGSGILTVSCCHPSCSPCSGSRPCRRIRRSARESCAISGRHLPRDCRPSG